MGEFIVEIFLRIVIVPTAPAMATPVILIKSFFSKEGYLKSLEDNYKRLFHWVMDWFVFS